MTSHGLRAIRQARKLDRGLCEAPLGFDQGPRYRLGATLARLELATTLPALARRLPCLRLNVPVTDIPWHHDLVDSGPLALPVTW